MVVEFDVKLSRDAIAFWTWCLIYYVAYLAHLVFVWTLFNLVNSWIRA